MVAVAAQRNPIDFGSSNSTEPAAKSWVSRVACIRDLPRTAFLQCNDLADGLSLSASWDPKRLLSTLDHIDTLVACRRDGGWNSLARAVVAAPDVKECMLAGASGGPDALYRRVFRSMQDLSHRSIHSRGAEKETQAEPELDDALALGSLARRSRGVLVLLLSEPGLASTALCRKPSVMPSTNASKPRLFLTLQGWLQFMHGQIVPDEPLSHPHLAEDPRSDVIPRNNYGSIMWCGGARKHNPARSLSYGSDSSTEV